MPARPMTGDQPSRPSRRPRPPSPRRRSDPQCGDSRRATPSRSLTRLGAAPMTDESARSALTVRRDDHTDTRIRSRPDAVAATGRDARQSHARRENTLRRPSQSRECIHSPPRPDHHPLAHGVRKRLTGGAGVSQPESCRGTAELLQSGDPFHGSMLAPPAPWRGDPRISVDTDRKPADV